MSRSNSPGGGGGPAMTPPMIALVAHRRSLDTVLGEQQAAIAYGGYVENLHAAGAALVVLAPGTRIPNAALDHLDGLLLTGGGDVAGERFGTDEEARDVDEARDEMEIALVRHCRDRRVPILGMCRGNEVLNVGLGGTLRTVPDHVQQEPLAEPVQKLEVAPGCRLAGVLGDTRLMANSFHRWAIDRPADGMKVTARAGDGVAEGIEWAADDWFAIGVQWHAELLDAPHVSSLFGAFVQAAGQERPS